MTSQLTDHSSAPTESIVFQSDASYIRTRTQRLPVKAEPLPSKAGKATLVKVEFTDSELDDLRKWIVSLPEPRPDEEQAVRMIVRDRIKKLSAFTST